MNKSSKSQFDSPKSGYWAESKRPWVSLVFLIPILAYYELGVFSLGSAAMRNGADGWLRGFLGYVGFSNYFLLPVLVCGLLLAWHHLLKQPWRFSLQVLPTMLLECILLAFGLLMFARFQHSIFASLGLAQLSTDDFLLLSISDQVVTYFKQTVAYCGAGVYEELLFRLMLMPVLVGILSLLKVKERKGWIWAAVLASFIFAAAHYGVADITTGKILTFDFLYSFSFRFFAGLFFSILFLVRGFGIAAGSHALYDIMTIIF